MSKTIDQIPEKDHPREKLLRKGASALSDQELLAVLLGKGTPGMDVMTLASKLARLIDEKGLEVNAEAIRLRDDIAFFQAVRSALVKPSGERKTQEDLDHAIRQLVSKAVSAEDEIIDVFTADVDLPVIEKKNPPRFTKGCVAVQSGDVTLEQASRVDRTIEILGLNRLPRLNEKRAQLWDKCRLAIADYKGAKGPSCFAIIEQAKATAMLKGMIKYDAEFSSVAEACVWKNAPQPLIAAVFCN